MSAAKIAGSIGILPCCVLHVNDFLSGFLNEGLLDLCGLTKPPYFVYGKLGVVPINVCITCWPKKREKKED